MKVSEKKVGEILVGEMQVGEKTWSVKLKVGEILEHPMKYNEVSLCLYMKEIPIKWIRFPARKY